MRKCEAKLVLRFALPIPNTLASRVYSFSALIRELSGSTLLLDENGRNLLLLYKPKIITRAIAIYQRLPRKYSEIINAVNAPASNSVLRKLIVQQFGISATGHAG